MGRELSALMAGLRQICTIGSWRNILLPVNIKELYVGKHPMGMARFSINCVLWFGNEMAEFKGEVPGDDEEFLSCIKPTQLGKG